MYGGHAKHGAAPLSRKGARPCRGAGRQATYQLAAGMRSVSSCCHTISAQLRSDERAQSLARSLIFTCSRLVRRNRRSGQMAKRWTTT
eukprot:6213358-Pleurochrysis_carterae.AAC.4